MGSELSDEAVARLIEVVREGPAEDLPSHESYDVERVLAAGGKKVTPISDTIVELADRKFKAPLVKKLKEAGVFVDQSSEPAVSKPRRRGRRRQW